MDVGVIVIVLVSLAVLAAVIVLGLRGRPSGPRSSRRPAWPSDVQPPPTGPATTVALPIAADDPDDPSVYRLVHQASERVFRASPDVVEVTVENRDGVALATIHRQRRLAEPEPVDREPAEGAQGSTWGTGRAPARSREGPPGPPADRSVARRFDLPDEVLGRLRDPDNLVDVVRAILEAGQRPAEVDGNVIRSGDLALVLVGEAWGSSASEALGNAFLRYQRTGAPRGLIISLGYVDPRDVERRQALAPDVRYGGSHTIQRMADAVAVGGDPIQLAIDLE